ncbi:MAG: nucleoside diphosphate kinase [Bacilli bacterium]|nr:nucleoside diphosphate kinase [Bacilli bacterium]
MEQTFIMVKPDGVQRALIGEIIKRLEAKGLQLVAGKLMKIRLDQAEQHYQEHQGKSYIQELIGFRMIIQMSYFEIFSN